MHMQRSNKYREAMNVLQRGRDALIEAMADDIVDQGPDLIGSGFVFHEFIESQGTRLHFLSLLMGQLELSADALDEQLAAEPTPEPPKPRRKRSRTRSRKAQDNLPSEESADDLG